MTVVIGETPAQIRCDEIKRGLTFMKCMRVYPSSLDPKVKLGLYA